MPRQSNFSGLWLFQGSLKYYRIDRSLRHEDGEFWNMRQHKDHVSVGDQVLIWIGGSQAGIYALGTVTEGPIFCADSPQSIQYYVNPEDAAVERWRVWINYEQKWLSDPLLKKELLGEKSLTDDKGSTLRVIRVPISGTNFPIELKQWEVLQSLLAGHMQK